MAGPAAAEVNGDRAAVVCPRRLFDRDRLPHRQNDAERHQRQLAVEHDRAIDRCQPAELFDDALCLCQKCVAEKPAERGIRRPIIADRGVWLDLTLERA